MTPWIKVEHTTPDKPEVVAMAAALGIDQDAVFGKLVRLWIWADANSVNGNALTVTEAWIDRHTHQPGLARAMRACGWLMGEDGNLTFPDFDRHNGSSAKERASTNRRVAKHRGNASTVTNVTPPPLQKPLPEEERESTLSLKRSTPPTLAEAREWAVIHNRGAGQSSGLQITSEMVALWHSDLSACGWVQIKGGVEIPIVDFKAHLHAWSIRYRNSPRASHSHSLNSTPKRHGQPPPSAVSSANPTDRYASSS